MVVAVKGIGPNFIKVGALGLTYWFSYETCIGVGDGKTNYLCTSQRGGAKWGKTTQGHINILAGMGRWTQNMSYAEFEAKVRELERQALKEWTPASE